MHRRQFNSLALALAGVAAAGPAHAGAVSHEDLMDRLEAFGFSGGVVAAERDRVRWTRACGWADQAAGHRFHGRTPFNIASVTKPVTALAVMGLVEQGRLSLDDTLGRRLSGVPADMARVTIAQLLSHSSGLPRQTRTRDVTERAQVLERLLAVKPEAKPGERFIYSNVGYALLAAITEEVTGGTWREAVRTRVFAPAGMRESGFAQDYRPASPIAHGYDEWNDLGDFRKTHQPGWYEGSGNVVSTLEDMGRLMLALEAGRIVSAETLALMTRPQSPGAGSTGYEAYGFGFYLGRTTAGAPYMTHTGDNPGYHGDLRWYPQERRWLYLVTTREAYDDSGQGVGPHTRVITNDIVRLLRREPATTPPAARRVDGADESALAGAWVAPDGSRLEIGRRRPREPQLTAVAHGQGAADAITGADAAAAAHNAAANRRALSLAELIRRQDVAALKTALRDVAFFAEGWVKDFADWTAKHGAFTGFGPLTSRVTPFGDPQVRTMVPFRFARGEALMEFTWNGEALHETLTERGHPSPAIVPVAALGGGRWATWDMALRRGVTLRLEGPVLVVEGANGATRFRRA